MYVRAFDENEWELGEHELYLTRPNDGANPLAKALDALLVKRPGFEIHSNHLDVSAAEAFLLTEPEPSLLQTIVEELRAMSDLLRRDKRIGLFISFCKPKRKHTDAMLKIADRLELVLTQAAV
jgi:hypothetical protein